MAREASGSSIISRLVWCSLAGLGYRVGSLHGSCNKSPCNSSEKITEGDHIKGTLVPERTINSLWYHSSGAGMSVDVLTQLTTWHRARNLAPWTSSLLCGNFTTTWSQNPQHNSPKASNSSKGHMILHTLGVQVHALPGMPCPF